MLKTFDRRYILLLAVVSCLILTAGGLLHLGQKALPAQQPAESIPFQRLSNKDDLQRISAYMSERVSEFEAHMVYLPEFGATGLAWDGKGTFLTAPLMGQASQNIVAATPNLSYALVSTPQHRQLRPVPRSAKASLAPEGWVLLVARRPGAQLIWRAAMAGGVAPVVCGDSTYREVVFTAPLDAAFAGGGLFDLEGMLLGMVSRCGERYVAISADDIEAGLRSGETLSGKLVREYGFQLAEMDAAAKAYFNVAQGLWVREVRNPGVAFDAGIEPGDILTAFGGRPVAALDDLALLGAGVLPTEPALTVLSSGKPRAVLLSRRAAALPAALPAAPDRDSGIRLESPARGLRVGSVLPESPASQAGLRPGDRIVRIGAKRNPDEKDFIAAFAPGRGETVFLVYERNAVERGALLAP